MEAAPKNEGIDKVLEGNENVDRAKEVYAQLKSFEGTDVVGSKALKDVESLAHELGLVLSEIPKKVRQEEGLPWHPLDEMAA